MESFAELFDVVADRMLETGKITEVVYNLWIKALVPVELNGNTAVFKTPTSFQKGIVENNYVPILKEEFSRLIGIPVEIEIICMDSDDKDLPTQEDMWHYDEETPIENEPYTFANFIVGHSNEFAFAAATAVAKNCGHSYNPLFIYGHSGLGKTHLMMAIQNEIKKLSPEKKIIYVSGENFTNELISAINSKTTEAFHNKYRSTDVLLMDDVQFISGKESTQEEFFHTFNELYKVNKQIVLTSDRPPKEIGTLEDRIRTRFEWGLIADISFPDFETRCAIIEQKTNHMGIRLKSDVVEFIASKLKNSIRQIEGVLLKLQAMNKFDGVVPTIAVAQMVINDILTNEQPISVTIDNIIQEVSVLYSVTPDDIRSKKRSAQISNARKVAAYIMREVTGMSFEDIGNEFGRDHATMIYSINSVSEQMEKDSKMKSMIEDTIKNLQGK